MAVRAVRLGAVPVWAVPERAPCPGSVLGVGESLGETARERPRVGVWWIVLSAVLLPAGWLGWISILLAASFGPEEERPSPGDQLAWSVTLTVLTAGIPLAIAVTYLVWRSRGRAVSWATPVACLVFAAAALLTTGFGTTVYIGQYRDDVERRAQPLTSVETSHSPNEVDRDIQRLGEDALTAVGADVTEYGQDLEREPCRLSNTEWGTKTTWSWPSSEDTYYDDPVDADTDRVDPAEAASRTEDAAALLEDEGLTIETTADGVDASGDGWISEASVSLTKTTTSVWVETTCLAGEDSR